MPKVAGNTNYKGTFSNYPHSAKGFSSNVGSKTSRGGGGQIRGVASGGYRSLRPASQMLLGTPEFINPTGVHHHTNEESPPKERDHVPEGYELHRISFSPPPHSKGPPSLSEDSSESSMFKQARTLKQPLLYVDMNLGLSSTRTWVSTPSCRASSPMWCSPARTSPQLSGSGPTPLTKM